MIASVHLVDLPIRRALTVLRRTPDPATVPGLLYAKVALAAPLRSSIRPCPDLHRPALIAFWDKDNSLDHFISDGAAARMFSGGWHARLEPLRAFGTWAGLPTNLTTRRCVDHDGPTAVLTLGRLRLPQTIRFLRTSAKAEAAVLHAPGLIWATGLGRPPFVATCSLWHSAHALSSYAYGPNDAAHPGAIAADRAKPFHHESAFIRFRPYACEGHLDGTNPLAPNALTVL
jgi:hypothetical protein